MNKTAIAILNWNNKNLLEKFLPNIINSSNNIADIYVIDNYSTDNSIEFIKSNFPSVGIIQNNKNYGFAKGYNIGLKEIKNKYLLLINSDVDVRKNWLEPLIQELENNEKMGACQPTILSYSDNSLYEYAGAAGGFIDYLGYPFCRGRIFNTIEKNNNHYKDSEIFWASGACFIIRNELFKKINGFDELFFAHMEEIDLCWRLQHLGYKIGFCSKSKVFHIGAATLNHSSKKTYLNYRNNLFMLCKNLHASKLIPILFKRLFLDGIAGVKLLSEGKLLHMLSIIKAHWVFYLTSYKVFSKRKEILSKSVLNSKNIYKKSIIQKYFIERKKTYKDLNWNPK